ncbi:RHS repeat-associated core domain-containing protein [Galbitalea sp. SE-J8]|uniref:RHS repeat-associated core domain-containing protein n=1 Tax=Galbitalea sp. SE-J8 TaxID=3054952 RepID=UPI00259C9D07|nr:RHS repeat-associated core domain-containing protein [Galbitalea sp. SE-J8]MDM4764389.1 RHS repeat-associated core domain-containing protein [Galbitalea sp. SE-J8]
MGARVYNPITGRFTSPDPVPGGNENAYNYPNDPIGDFDVDGNMAEWALAAEAAIGSAELADLSMDWNPIGWGIAGVLGLAAVGIFIADAASAGGSAAEAKAHRGGRNGGNSDRKSSSSNTSKTKKAARARAKRDAKRSSCGEYRGLCAKKDHYHVDYKQGDREHTVHYRWRPGNGNKKK